MTRVKAVWPLGISLVIFINSLLCTIDKNPNGDNSTANSLIFLIYVVVAYTQMCKYVGSINYL